jgi:diguanylate cyclase (GGDEF)-like protein
VSRRSKTPRLSVARKIVFLSLTIGAIFATVAVIGLMQTKQLAGQLEEQYNTDVVAVGHMTEISQAMAEQHSAVLSYILSDPGFYRDSYAEAIARTDGTINSELAALNQLELTPSQLNQVQSLEALLPAWRSYRDTALAASAEGDRARATSIVLVRSQAITKALQTRVDSIVGELDKAVAQGNRDAQESSQRTIEIMVVGLIGATMIAVTLSILVARGIARPLAEAVAVLRRVGGGDLSRRLSADTRDEVGEMARSLNKTLDVLEDSFATMRHQATHDSLTGLPNRASFHTQAVDVLNRATSRSNAALLLIDLNAFKSVNDVYGHAAGDALLAAIGRRLKNQIRPVDIAARLGGDEFAVLLDGLGEEEAYAAAARLQQAIQAPAAFNDLTLLPQASVGIAFWNHEDDIEKFLHEADLAMYTAKAESRIDVGLLTTASHPRRSANAGKTRR